MKEEVKGTAAAEACLRAGLLAQLPHSHPGSAVCNYGQFSQDSSPGAARAIFSAWSHFMYLSPTTQELWQSQAWPLLHLSIFTMDFCSNGSALLTQITCTISPLIYWFLYSYEHELISSLSFLLLIISLKRTGLFPSPPSPSHLPRATGHYWDTATHFEVVYTNMFSLQEHLH